MLPLRMISTIFCIVLNMHHLILNCPVTDCFLPPEPLIMYMMRQMIEGISRDRSNEITKNCHPSFQQFCYINQTANFHLTSKMNVMSHTCVCARKCFNTHALLTQQNSYSISHLLGTVTTQWLSLWRCSHCSLVPDTVTTEQWLHRTHTLLGIHYHGAYVEICLLRHLVGNYTVTTWDDTRYLLHTVTV